MNKRDAAVSTQYLGPLRSSGSRYAKFDLQSYLKIDFWEGEGLSIRTIALITRLHLPRGLCELVLMSMCLTVTRPTRYQARCRLASPCRMSSLSFPPWFSTFYSQTQSASRSSRSIKNDQTIVYLVGNRSMAVFVKHAHQKLGASKRYCLPTPALAE